MSEIPYPPVFRDWRRDPDIRIATSIGPAGLRIETMHPDKPGVWREIQLSEQDGCLFAASIIEKVAHVDGEPADRKLLKLVGKIVKEAGRL